MFKKPIGHVTYLYLALLFLLTLPAFEHTSAQARVDFRGTREINTGIKWGGRTYSLAVNPANADIVIAATESGGLKKTINRGLSWRHLTNFPCRALIDIAYTDATGNNIIATTKDDFKAVNGAGIWRSEDGGNSWVQCPVTFDNPAASCNGRLICWNIAKSRNRILIATMCGIAVSTDGGRSFTHKSVAGLESAFFSIAASGNRVIIGGSAGVFHSENEGDDFTKETTGIGNVSDFHAVTWSDEFGAGVPVAYAVNRTANLFFSRDGGQSWNPIPTIAPASIGCGGSQFITVMKSGTGVQSLYFGNRCGAYLMVCSRIRGGGNYDFSYTNRWVTLNFEHGTDCYQMVFDKSTTPAVAYMLATDGGVEGANDRNGLSWRSIGKAATGFNALQVIDVKGQEVATWLGRSQTLYFGTQDNALWASNNGGRSFPYFTGAEGDNFQMVRMASSYATTQINFSACGPCKNKVSKPLFQNEVLWNNTPNFITTPYILKEGVLIQYHGASASGSQGISIIRNADGRWRNLVDLPGDFSGAPKLSRTSAAYVLYQGIRSRNSDPVTGADTVKLVKVNNFDETGTLTPTVSYAGMANFGTFGVMATVGLPGNEVYDVDYNNPNNLIAADYLSQKMKRSKNGGDRWEDLDELTRMITDDGRLNFRYSNIAGGLGRYTQACLVSYHPDISGFVIVATQEGGVFFSSDNGDNWVKIPGSENINTASSAYWAGTNKIYLSSYGRGLWEINYAMHGRFADLPIICETPCFDYADPVTRLIRQKLNEDKISTVLVAHGGVINGWRVKANRLTEVMVTPGTQVVFYDKETAKEISNAIQITETSKDGRYDGANELIQEQLKLQKNIQGLSIREGGIGEILLSKKVPEHIKSMPVKFVKDFVRVNPENDGKPIIYLKGENMINGMPVLSAGANNITISGVYFKEGKNPITILVDDKEYTEVYPNSNGGFSLTMKGVFTVGSHRIKALQKTGNSELTYTNYFQCRNSDRK